MDILLEKVYPETIRLMGRWKINKMIYYLHTTTKSFKEGLSVCMLQHGDYVLIPPAHAGF